jgi:mannose-1-phosphate guanylyltransferase
MKNIILCGGNGTRLWPISHNCLPKQFIKLFNNTSLFQQTINRNKYLCHESIIISNENQYFLAQDQIEEIDYHNAKYILEPSPRDTAGAICIASLLLDKEEIILITPSDHLIKDEKEYQKVIQKAKKLAQEDSIVIFGANADIPSTQFGYIKYNNENVVQFVEKPDINTARQYIKDGNYYFNCGIFCAKVGVLLQEIQKYAPDIYQASKQAINNAKISNNTTRILQEDMVKIPKNSIDYALMEHTKNLKVIKANIDFTDLGSFDALYKELPKDKDNNTIYKKHFSSNSKNNLIYGNKKYIATLDIEDMIIIDTQDILFISKKNNSHNLKNMVEKLTKDNQLINIDSIVYRPWGIYTILEDTNGYKIKRIEVKPKKRLSLQSHKYRNEHWIIISGTATITLENEIFTLNENESTYIKANQKHRLANNTDKPLIIIEAQIGSYTQEDDIKRYNDDFSRK